MVGGGGVGMRKGRRVYIEDGGGEGGDKEGEEGGEEGGEKGGDEEGDEGGGGGWGLKCSCWKVIATHSPSA